MKNASATFMKSLTSNTLYTFRCVFASALLIWLTLAPQCQAASKQPIYFLAETQQSWQLFRISSDGSNLHQVLATEHDVVKLSILSEGQKLLLITSDRKIFLVDPKTGKKTEVEVGMKGMVDAVFSKNGDKLLFSLSTGGSNDANHIWLADVVTKKITQLTRMKDMQHNPIWSYNDVYIFFLSGGGGQYHDIWRLDVNTGSLNQLTAGQLYNFEAACSIDDEIAFSSNRSGDYEIWAMDPFGGNVRQLTHSSGMDSQPSWSPDGEKLVFVSNRNGQSALYVTDRDGKTTRRLSPEGLICRNPVWGR